MTIKRLRAAGALLCLAAMLGACAPFSGYVADHVPHWAGGLPPDAPPRPGAPGYDDFIAHGEPAQTTATPPSGAEPGAASTTTGTATPIGAIPPNSAAMTSEPQFQARNGQTQNGQAQNSQAQKGKKRSHSPAAPAQASAQRAPQAAAPAEPVEAPAGEDPSVVKGGLY
ncbi:MAG TPA: hypothetical protein VHU22_07380 [Xanthobacteraceae bacterium]|jgi:hypothetical protein|nr:hypothetical protein [Xanthobacteraceae bacterium]